MVIKPLFRSSDAAGNILFVFGRQLVAGKDIRERINFMCTFMDNSNCGSILQINGILRPTVAGERNIVRDVI